MSKFIIKKAKSGLMFNFVASNGEVVATSEVYTTKKALTNKKFENIFLTSFLSETSNKFLTKLTA